MAATYMDTSSSSSSGGADMSPDEPTLDEAAARALLAEKEEDLLLAAELGKALLEKNEQLSCDNERCAAEYARHLEDLEQERHMLRRRISAMEGENEDEVVQLQTDIAAIRQQIQTQHHSGKDCDKQRSQMLEDMTEQNQRLARQLRDAVKAEKQTTERLEQLRRQKDLRRDSFEFHVSHVDDMKEELASLEQQRRELERRERSLLEDREQLEDRLQETAERQLLLERLQRERSGQVRDQRRQLDQLAAANSSLGDRLDAAAGLGSPASTGGHTSLHHELDSSADEGIGSVTNIPSADVILMEFGDEVECDEPLAASSGTSNSQQLRSEALLTISQLKALAELARVGRTQTDSSQSGTDTSHTMADSSLAGTDSVLGGMDSALGGTDSNMSVVPPSEPSLDVTLMESTIHDATKLQPGDLREAFLTLRSELASLLPAVCTDGECNNCGRPAELPIQQQLLTVSQRHEQLQQQHQQQTETLQQLQTEQDRHDKQLAMREKQCIALQEEKEVLKTELDTAYLSKEDLVRKAWEARDQAVRRKNNAEMELSKARIDVLQTNSQLLESIQHKVQLSCQLDEWQWDMQELIEAEIHKKLVINEKSRANRNATAPAKSRRSIMSFFSRS